MEKDMQTLRIDLLRMWVAVRAQLGKTSLAMRTGDKDLAHEVLRNEKRIRSWELSLTENAARRMSLKTNTPTELRALISFLKIITNLNAVGEITLGVARDILLSRQLPSAKLLELSGVEGAYLLLLKRLEKGQDTLEQGRTTDMGAVAGPELRFQSEWNQKEGRFQQLLHEDPTAPAGMLYLASIMRRLEGISGHLDMIARSAYYLPETEMMAYEA
jgi:phosphate uptake regulator